MQHDEFIGQVQNRAHLSSRGDAERACDAELLWEEFHRIVNMTSDELRTWLLTQASGEGVLPPDPDVRLSGLGRRVVEVLRKRKVDLTADDTAAMQDVVDYVEDQLASPPTTGATDDKWRRSLMTVGHDPLRP
jgi:Protein of unknown function (DUF3140)